MLPDCVLVGCLDCLLFVGYCSSFLFVLFVYCVTGLRLLLFACLVFSCCILALIVFWFACLTGFV